MTKQLIPDDQARKDLLARLGKALDLRRKTTNGIGAVTDVSNHLREHYQIDGTRALILSLAEELANRRSIPWPDPINGPQTEEYNPDWQQTIADAVLLQ
jgi:hypothetical protein